MIECEAVKILKEDSCWECSYGTMFGATQCGNTQCNVARATNLAINALEVKEKITEIVNRQLIAGKNNYKEIYDCFYEIVKVVQDNY